MVATVFSLPFRRPARLGSNTLSKMSRGVNREWRRHHTSASEKQLQQLVFERVIAAPIWEIAFTSGVGPRIEESALGLIPNWAFAYEDVRLKAK
jgi:hypothetical protein